MNEIIINYIVQAILGGASGYITNDYAINMLFKEYTPLKIGGVIKKNRLEFIENLSSMVENDIINKDKLQEILSDESFTTEFENLTADFYENCLYEEASSDIFGQIDGFDSTIKSTDIFVAKILNEHMPKFYSLMIESLNLSDFLSSSQQNKIGDSIYSLLIDIFNNTDIFEKLLFALFEGNNELVLTNVLDKSKYETIINNVVSLITKALSESNNSEIKDIINSIGFENALNSSKGILYTKKIKDVINKDCDILINLNDSLLSIVNSENGINSINDLCSSLFNYGKECNKSIFQLLDSSFEENLKMYLVKNIPFLTEDIINWINENSPLIDNLIEDSIDEVIKESDSLKAKLLTKLKNTYYSSLSKKYSIADKIISYIKKVAEPGKLSQHISDKLIDVLNNLTVSEIIAEAENNNFTPEKAGKLIINYINNNSESILNKTVEYTSEIEIGKLLPDKLINDELITNIINKFKELTASNSVKEYLTKKSTEYADNMLSKELSKLVNDEQSKVIALKTKDFIKEKITSKEELIKKWIIAQIARIATAAEAHPSIKLNQNSINQLNDKIFKNYSEAAEELKDIHLSSALDKLNSIENLAKISSESLHSYAVKNTDVIFNDSVKAIVTDNLNKLNDDELVDLANDFIGRELKPVMYFGGVLGVLAGIILAAFQNLPLDPGKINVANTVVYAFVGYITNVIAINMLFRPYKEIKLISKMPFLRNFSLGYIIKSQKIFANKTAHFIDNSLLSKKSINELFDKHKNKIKLSFTKNIADNDYRTLSNLLANNKHNIVKCVYLYLKNKVSNSKINIGCYFYSKIKNIKASTLMNDKVINKLNILLTSKVKDSDLSSNIYHFINSDNTIDSKFSGDCIKNYITKTENNYLNKLSAMFSEKNKFDIFIIKYESNYQRLVSKQINEIIAFEKREKLAQWAADKIYGIVLSKDSRNKATESALNLFNNSVNRKTFNELFNGKFKDYVDSHMPKMLESINNGIKNNIKDNKSKISVMVQSEIKNNLGFIEKGMYSIMGGDEIVDELLAKIITVKIPQFIDDKKLVLNNIIIDFLEERFYSSKVEVLNTGLNKLQFTELVNNYLRPENLTKVGNKINSATKELLSRLGSIRLSNVLKLLYMNDLNSLLNVYGSEINSFTNDLSITLKNNKMQIIEKVSKYTDSLIDELVKVEFKQVFNGISKEDIKLSIDKTVIELNKNRDIQKIINYALNDCKDYMKIKEMKIGSFIDKDDFVKASKHYFTSLLESNEFEEAVKQHFGEIIDEAILVNFNFVDDKTKKYVLDIFVESCINSLRRNLDKILKVVEFDKIAQDEIEKMEPKKIHDMFNSFGQKYFRRLMLYGFGGFVFGINMYVGISLTLLKIISQLINKNK